MIDLFLLLAVTINGICMGRIIGVLTGQLLGKLINCAIGFHIDFINRDTGVTHTEYFRWKEAWTALSDIERLKRYHRDNQAPGR